SRRRACPTTNVSRYDWTRVRISAAVVISRVFAVDGWCAVMLWSPPWGVRHVCPGSCPQRYPGAVTRRASACDGPGTGGEDAHPENFSPVDGRPRPGDGWGRSVGTAARADRDFRVNPRRANDTGVVHTLWRSRAPLFTRCARHAREGRTTLV